MLLDGSANITHRLKRLVCAIAYPILGFPPGVGVGGIGKMEARIDPRKRLRGGVENAFLKGKIEKASAATLIDLGAVNGFFDKAVPLAFGQLDARENALLCLY